MVSKRQIWYFLIHKKTPWLVLNISLKIGILFRYLFCKIELMICIA